MSKKYKFTGKVNVVGDLVAPRNKNGSRRYISQDDMRFYEINAHEGDEITVEVWFNGDIPRYVTTSGVSRLFHITNLAILRTTSSSEYFDFNMHWATP